MDIFCLHYIFLPRINASLNSIQLAWNNHSLSTENSRSPIQIYTCDSIRISMFQESNNPMGLFQHDQTHTTVTVPDEMDTVNVPEMISPLSRSDMGYLNIMVNPLQSSTNCSVTQLTLTLPTIYSIISFL